MQQTSNRIIHQLNRVVDSEHFLEEDKLSDN
jgi:hypothetical protein